MVGLSWVFVSARYLLGGLSVDFGFTKIDIAGTSSVDYGAAVAVVLAVWLGREWVKENRNRKADV